MPFFAPVAALEGLELAVAEAFVAASLAAAA